jgi:hypothetical protein
MIHDKLEHNMQEFTNTMQQNYKQHIYSYVYVPLHDNLCFVRLVCHNQYNQ